MLQQKDSLESSIRRKVLHHQHFYELFFSVYKNMQANLSA